jgi:hypothetical protein
MKIGKKGYNLMLAIINKTTGFIQHLNQADKKGIRIFSST